MVIETIEKKTSNSASQPASVKTIEQEPRPFPTIPVYFPGDGKEYNGGISTFYRENFLREEAEGRLFSKVYVNGPPPFLVFEVNAYNYILPEDLKEGKEKKDEKEANSLISISECITIPKKHIKGANKTPKYTLSSILFHRGGAFDQSTKDRDGHYFSAFKAGASWYICDSAKHEYSVISDTEMLRLLKKDCNPKLKSHKIRMLIYNLVEEKKE